MKRMKRLSIGVVLFVVVAIVMSVCAFADFSGKDADIEWNIDTTNGVLTLNGFGQMNTYEFGKAPWYEYNSYVKSIVFKGNISGISKGAFYGMDSVESLTIPFVGATSSDDGNAYLGYIFGAGKYYENSTYIPESLKLVEVTNATTIYSFSFNYCEAIKEIILGDSVVTINEKAFKDCQGLESVVFGSGIKTIALDAFYNCSAIENVFYKSTATNWAKVTVSDSKVSNPICLGDGTLSATSPDKSRYFIGEKFNSTGISVSFGGNNVTSAAKIIAPDMSSVGVKAYTIRYGSLTTTGNVEVVANETSGIAGSVCWSFNTENGELIISGEGMMDDYTLEILPPWYQYRNSINKVTVQSGVESVGDYAFYSHSNLEEVVLAASVSSVGYAAFEGAVKLSDVTLGNSDAIVNGTAFRGCNELVYTSGSNEYYVVNGNNYYMLKSSTSASINANTVVIGENAFKGASFTEITIPNGIISIGDGAFKDCTSLQKVVFGNSIAFIGNSAFEGCSSLDDVTFNKAPEYVGVLAFAECPLVTNEYDNALYIGSDDNPYMILLSAKSANIVSCEINESAVTIASLAFANCKQLKTVSFPEGLRYIGDSAFNGCLNLYSIELPFSISKIGTLAFSDCVNLSIVDIKGAVETIGNGAFRGASSLEKIVLPFSVKSLGYNAFRDCTSLKTVGISAGVKSIGYKTFYGCESLVNVYLPDGLYSIGDYAFSGASAIESIAVPSSVTAIGFGAFIGCDSIEAISLPFIGDSENGKYQFIGYIFGAISAGNNADVVPTTLKTVLADSDIVSGMLNGVSLTNLIVDKKTASIVSGIQAKNVYYLGTANEWSNVSGSASYDNVSYFNNTFTLTPPATSSYRVGDMIELSDLSASGAGLDLMSLVRISSNPIVLSGSEVDIPVYVGSIYVTFEANVEDDLSITDFSLILEGSIGVKIYVKLSEYAINYYDEIVTTVDFKGQEHNVTLVNCGDVKNPSLYYTKFYVAAKEMHDDITVTVDALGAKETATVSVKKYVDLINLNPTDYADSIDLVNAVYDFGEYSRKYFHKGAEEITINPKNDVTDVELEVPATYSPVKVGTVSGIRIYSTSLLLESNTTIRHYFKLDEGASIDDYEFHVDGTVNLKAQEKEGYYYVDISNILAHKLGDMRVLTVSKGDEYAKFVYSPLSYVRIVTGLNDEDETNLNNLVKSLYLYYIESRDYFKLINPLVVVPGANEVTSQMW